ncbi:MAG: HAD-IG family 5'-nucleotidase [Acidobacteriota bacterium]
MPLSVHSAPPAGRRVFANRTLNLRAIKAIGYDMDYTLVHYRVEPWERRAYETLREKLADRDFPVEGLEYQPALVVRGLVVDRELGNLLKANRFGYVVRAAHGTRPLEFEEMRRSYGRTLVELGEERWAFLNTLFSLSEACMYAQLVDRLDARGVGGAVGYGDLYRSVRQAIDEAHFEGELKDAILADPDRYVERDPDLPLALLDQKIAGRRLLLITNSEWSYTAKMMAYALDPFLPPPTTWRDLFELVVVSARKPDFFERTMPAFQVATSDGLLRPCPGGITRPGTYVGGDAGQVQAYLDVAGEEILYVGDHIYTDVHVTKNVTRWRTALILRELEDEVAAQDTFRGTQAELSELMAEKTRLEQVSCRARLALQRLEHGYGPPAEVEAEEARHRLNELRVRQEALDERVAPLARAASELANGAWGPVMRAGNDKSYLARQVERYADIYTSRVSNFLFETPFAYLRAPRTTLPHDAAQAQE